MLKIGIILGSTRPGRVGEQVAKWVLEHSAKRKDAEFEMVDLRDFNLPVLDEPYPAGMEKYTNEHTKIFSRKIAEFDGFIFVTGEYNHSIPGALKNAIDYNYVDWNNKAAGFVSYGSAGGSRAVEHLRQVMGELQVADVRAQVMFSLFTDFENMSVFQPDPRHLPELEVLLDQLLLWSGALKGIRK